MSDLEVKSAIILIEGMASVHESSRGCKPNGRALISGKIKAGTGAVDGVVGKWRHRGATVENHNDGELINWMSIKLIHSINMWIGFWMLLIRITCQLINKSHRRQIHLQNQTKKRKQFIHMQRSENCLPNLLFRDKVLHVMELES